MGLRFLCALLPLATAMAQNPLGPTVYLADLHEVGEGTILHWKANIARPEFFELRVFDADGVEIARVKAPQNQLDVSGRKGLFRLQPLRADGTAGGASPQRSTPWKNELPSGSSARGGTYCWSKSAHSRLVCWPELSEEATTWAR